MRCETMCLLYLPVSSPVETPPSPTSTGSSDESQNNNLVSKVKHLVSGMSSEEVRDIIGKLRDDLKIAKRQQEEREREGTTARELIYWYIGTFSIFRKLYYQAI